MFVWHNIWSNVVLINLTPHHERTQVFIRQNQWGLKLTAERSCTVCESEFLGETIIKHTSIYKQILDFNTIGNFKVLTDLPTPNFDSWNNLGSVFFTDKTGLLDCRIQRKYPLKLLKILFGLLDAQIFIYNIVCIIVNCVKLGGYLNIQIIKASGWVRVCKGNVCNLVVYMMWYDGVNPYDYGRMYNAVSTI